MKEKINVLMCCSKLDVKGGMVSVVKNYLNYDNWNEYIIDYVPTYIEKNKLVMAIYYLISFIKIIVKTNIKHYQIAHLHTAEKGSFYRKTLLLKYLKRKNIKVILHHHAAEFEEFYASLSESGQKYVNEMLELADVNIVLSNRLIRMIKDKANNAHVEVLYNSVNTFKENPYNSQNKGILFLGRLGERKGTYDLLEVIKQLDNELDSNIHFYLCGDGEIENVQEKIKELNISHRIAHVGWCSGIQKSEILSKCYLNVLPSYNEGLPMTILETMAMGIPNISTNIASIPEVIHHDENGYLINPGDKEKLKEYILELTNNIEKRERFSNNSYELIKNNFSLDVNLEQLKKIYKELLNNGV